MDDVPFRVVRGRFMGLLPIAFADSCGMGRSLALPWACPTGCELKGFDFTLNTLFRELPSTMVMIIGRQEICSDDYEASGPGRAGFAPADREKP